jgi:hypothetical protein
LFALFPRMSGFAVWGNALRAQTIIFRFSDGLGKRQVVCFSGVNDVFAVEERAPEKSLGLGLLEDVELALW